MNYSGDPFGSDVLDDAEFKKSEVMLRSTPLDWLAANGDGVCILDWRMSERALRAD